MNTQESLLKTCGLRIICAVLIRSAENPSECIYRFYTSDGGYVEYCGWNNVPVWCQEWIKVRNGFNHCLTPVMFVSGCFVGCGGNG